MWHNEKESNKNRHKLAHSGSAKKKKKRDTRKVNWTEPLGYGREKWHIKKNKREMASSKLNAIDDAMREYRKKKSVFLFRQGEPTHTYK